MSPALPAAWERQKASRQGLSGLLDTALQLTSH